MSDARAWLGRTKRRVLGDGAPAPHARASQRGIIHKIDRICRPPGQCWQIVGWAVDPNNPSRRLAIDLSVDGALLAAGSADKTRLDVLAAGLGDGHNGFTLEVTDEDSIASALLDVDVRVDGHSSREAVVVDALLGSVDSFDGRVLRGWVANRLAPGSPLDLDVLLDGVLAGHVRADGYRHDLWTLGLGNSAFEWVVPDRFCQGRTVSYHLRVANGLRSFAAGRSSKPVSRDADDPQHYRRLWLASDFEEAGRAPLQDDEAELHVGGHADDRSRSLEVRERQLSSDRGDPLGLSSRDGAILFDRSDVRPGLARTVSGRIEAQGEVALAGWVDVPWTQERLLVDIFVDGVWVDTVEADRVAGKPSSRRVFETTLPLTCFDGAFHRATARLTNTGAVLEGHVDIRLGVDVMDPDTLSDVFAAERRRGRRQRARAAIQTGPS